MVAGGTYSIGVLALTALGQATSVAIATIVAGSFSLLGTLCYLPALRRERKGSETRV
jgi:hypothetical protein